MEARSQEVKTDLAVRLRRIEGQVRGVQRMVEEDRDCPEILQQMAAIRSAVRHASLLVARAYAVHCLEGPVARDSEAVIDTLIETLGRLE